MALIPDLTNEKVYLGQSEGQMPEGRFLLMVNLVEEVTSGAGNKVHKATLVGVDEPNEGKVAHDSFTLSHEVGRARYKGFITMCGFSKYDNLDTALLQGRLVFAKVEHEDVDFGDGKGPVMIAKIVAYRAILREKTPDGTAPVVGQHEGRKPPDGKPTWREGAPPADRKYEQGFDDQPPPAEPAF